MATVKHEQGSRPAEDSEPAHGAEPDLDPADFELDELLRKLRLDQWFATVEADMPIWVH